MLANASAPSAERGLLHKSDAPGPLHPNAGGTMKKARTAAAGSCCRPSNDNTDYCADLESDNDPDERHSHFFSQTGFRIDTEAFSNFFQQRGDVRTFGYPVSRTFTLDGFEVQISQREVMQLQPNGGVQKLNPLDAGLMPYTKINGTRFRRPIRQWRRRPRR
jgi:hypothetical protein